MKRNIILYIVGICSILIGCGEYPGPHTFAPNVLNGEVYNIYRYGATVDGVFIKPDTDAGSVSDAVSYFHSTLVWQKQIQ